MEKQVIGICDDQKEVAFELSEVVQSIQKSWNCEWDVRLYTSGEELLKEINGIDIVFLDIEMPEIDGIEVGKKIKLINPYCKIIMATGKVERFKEAFQIHAVRFITKPFEKKEVEEALEAAITMSFGGNTIELYNMRIAHNIPQYMICYVEAYNGYTEFMVDNHIFRKEVSLTELESILDDRLFFRINRQYIINFRWINAYLKEEIQINGNVFKISRRKKKEFEKKYIEFDLKYRWGFE